MNSAELTMLSSITECLLTVSTGNWPSICTLNPIVGATDAGESENAGGTIGAGAGADAGALGALGAAKTLEEKSMMFCVKASELKVAVSLIV